MIKCDKCGFGHKTEQEYDTCKSWDELIKEAGSVEQLVANLRGRFELNAPRPQEEKRHE